jgi:hypothetical protein
MNSADIAPTIMGTVLFVSIAVVLVLRGPLGKALARRIEGGTDAPDPRVAELEHRVADLEHAQARVLELEERLEFAERLLARGEAPARSASEEEHR